MGQREAGKVQGAEEDLFHRDHAKDSHGQDPAEDCGGADAEEREAEGEAVGDRHCIYG